MSAKHTPGPWRPTFGQLVRVFPKGSNSPICGVHIRGKFVGKQKRSHEEADANARLIAAAPDMLEALKEIETRLSGDGYVDSDDKVAGLMSIRAAIAKAEGVKEKDNG